MAARGPIEDYGPVFQKDFGLRFGMYDRNGRCSFKKGEFIDDILFSCYVEHFLTVRGFTLDASVAFDPKIVLIGSLPDDACLIPEIRGRYYGIRTQNIIIERTKSKPGSIIILQGVRPDYSIAYDWNFYRFDVRFVDDLFYLKKLEETRRLGIRLSDVYPDADKNRTKVFTKEILNAASEAQDNKKVFVNLHLDYLVSKRLILHELEKNNQSYVLLAPRKFYPYECISSKPPTASQKRYEIDLIMSSLARPETYLKRSQRRSKKEIMLYRMMGALIQEWHHNK